MLFGCFANKYKKGNPENIYFPAYEPATPANWLYLYLCEPERVMDKLFYSIGEVSRMLGVERSTLRYWEQEFSIIKPHTSKKGTRQYTPSDIKKLRTVQHLLRERGLSIDGAKRSLKHNPDAEVRRVDVLERLEKVRKELMAIRTTLEMIKNEANGHGEQG